VKLSLRPKGSTDTLEFLVNGTVHRATQVAPASSLLQYLRAHRLVAAKAGCTRGNCGACSVILVDRHASGEPLFRAIPACLTALPMVAGRELLTPEAFATHPAAALVHGAPCGFCAPGTITRLFEAFHDPAPLTRERLAEYLDTPACGCRPPRTAWLAAAASATHPARQPGDPGASFFRKVLASAPREAGPLDYVGGGGRFARPATLAELFTLRTERPHAVLLGGGTQLLAEHASRGSSPGDLISTEAVAELQRLERVDNEWHVGAAVPIARLDEALGLALPALTRALRAWGTRPLRNRATLAGALLSGATRGELAPALLALDAFLILSSPAGDRALWLDAFLDADGKPAIKPGEIVREVVIPDPVTPAGSQRFFDTHRLAPRHGPGQPHLAVAFRIDIGSDNTVTDARVAVGAATAFPRRLTATEQSLAGEPWTRVTIERAAEAAASELHPLDEPAAPAEYRRNALRGLLEVFFEGELTPAPDTAPVTAPESIPGASGETFVPPADFTDDLAEHPGTLVAWPILSPHAHARLTHRDTAPARHLPGVVAILLAEDIPGPDPSVDGLPLLARDTLAYRGQPLGLVIAESRDAARLAAAQVVLNCEPLAATLSLTDAARDPSLLAPAATLRRGSADRLLGEAPHRIEGELEIAPGDPSPLEPHAAWARPEADGSLTVGSSVGYPAGVRRAVACALGMPQHRIRVTAKRLGGPPGTGQHAPAAWAALAAVAAARTAQPVRLCLDRAQMQQSPPRRPAVLARYEAGFDATGRITALRVRLFVDAGAGAEEPRALLDPILLHLDNAYYLPHLLAEARACRTNLPPAQHGRDGGALAGIVVIEDILDRVARTLGLAPELVRERNLYHGLGDTNTHPSGQELGDNRLIPLWNRLRDTSGFERRRRDIAQWNALHPTRKRGLAIVPAKCGLAPASVPVAQTSVQLTVFEDGSVLLHHGAPDAGIGLPARLRDTVADMLGIPHGAVRVETHDSPAAHAAPCAASDSAPACRAARLAAGALRKRLTPIAVKVLSDRCGTPPAPSRLVFERGSVSAPGCPATLPFAELCGRALRDGVDLHAAGHDHAVDAPFDPATLSGQPFARFHLAAAIAEVELDARTGRFTVRRADLLLDPGDPAHAALDERLAQSGFAQGIDFLTGDVLAWRADGSALPGSARLAPFPADWRLAFYDDTPAGDPPGSAALIAPPVVLALSVREALRDAVAAFGSGTAPIPLPVPSTQPALQRAVVLRRPRHVPPPHEPDASTEPIPDPVLSPGSP
jgi:xanthine dehydrogenase large subunit